MAKYRYNADTGQPVPVETDTERLEREDRESTEAREVAWRLELEERESRRVGAYL